MTRRKLEDLQRQWRTAESRGDDAGADAAFAALFRELPLEAPRPGFAAATLARVRQDAAVWGAEAVPAPQTAMERATPSAVRWAAASLALLSLATLALSAFVVTVLPRLAPSGFVATFNRAVVETWQWIAAGIKLWVQAAEWSALLSRVVAVPEIGWTLVGSSLAALMALSLLRRILAHEKEPLYAEP
jgi:hypothetical protein